MNLCICVDLVNSGVFSMELRKAAFVSSNTSVLDCEQEAGQNQVHVN